VAPLLGSTALVALLAEEPFNPEGTIDYDEFAKAVSAILVGRCPPQRPRVTPAPCAWCEASGSLTPLSALTHVCAPPPSRQIKSFPERLNHYAATFVMFFQSRWIPLKQGALVQVGYLLANLPLGERYRVGIDHVCSGQYVLLSKRWLTPLRVMWYSDD